MVSETIKRAQAAADEAIKKAKEAADATLKKAGEVADAAKDATVNTAASVAMSDTEKKIAQKMGITGKDLSYFRKESEANKELGNIFTNLENEMANDPKYDQLLAAFGTRFKEEAAKNKLDTSKDTIIDIIGKDIRNNPSLGEKLEEAMKKHPDQFAARLAGYKGGELSKIITEVTTPALTPAEAAAKAKAEAAAKAAAAAAPAVAPVAPVVAAPSSKPVTPAPAATAPVAPAAAKPAPPAATPVAVAAAAVTAPSNDPIEDLINDLAQEKDPEILNNIVKNSIDAKTVVGIAAKIADTATNKFGVPSPLSDGFAERIKKDTKLAGDIASNLQNNPAFVQSLARMSKDQSKLEEPFKSAAQQKMTKLMENPQNLASDTYVKELQSEIEQAEALKKNGLMALFGHFFKGGFGKMGAQIGGGVGEIGHYASALGQDGVISMSRGSSSIFPNFFIDLDRLNGGINESKAFSRYNPSQMTAFSKANAKGEYFEEKMVTGPDGKQTKEKVPIGQITLKTASGGEIKVIPSTGELMAKQEAGRFDHTGKFIPGNVHVTVVDGLDEKGKASSIKRISLSPEEFAKYKAGVDADARSRGEPELAFQDYTARDAVAAGKSSGVQMASVNPATGAVSPAAPMAAVASVYTGPGVSKYVTDRNGDLIPA